jgi:hypothetical protein
MPFPQRYSYTPRWLPIGAAALFFGVCAAFMAHKAFHNEAGLIINGLITLGPSGATVFYWIIAVTAALFVVTAFLLVIRRLINPQILEVQEDVILIPYGFLTTRISRVAYRDLQRVWETEVSGQRFLCFIAAGLKYSIAASMLPDKESYAALKDLLHSRLPHGRPAAEPDKAA